MTKILLKNALVINGSGKKAFKGDVALEGEEVFDVGNLKNLKAAQEIDLNGLAVAPGFIDIKSRIDFDWSFLNCPELKNLVNQGITTVFAGNFGFSPFPIIGDNVAAELERWAPFTNVTFNWSSLEEFFSVLEKKGIGVNFGTFLGYRVLRRGVIGEIDRPLKKEEVRIIKKIIGESLENGAFGVSLEFSKMPNNPDSDEELFEIFKILRGKRAVLSLNFAYGEKESPTGLLKNLIKTAKKMGISLEVSEFTTREKSLGEFFHLMEKAEKSGLDIKISATPFQEDVISLSSYFPSWIQEGGPGNMIRRLQEKEVKKLLLRALKKREKEFLRLRIAQAPLNPKFVGARFKEISKKQEVSGGEALINLLLATDGRALGIRYLKEMTDENDLEKIIKNPLSIITAEAGGHKNFRHEKGALPHPRDYGAFPYFIQHFAIDKKILSIEKAIHKITGLPASKLGLKKRGLVKKGYFGDLVVFNPKEIGSNADFRNPYAFSSGIKMVFINSQIAYNSAGSPKSSNGKFHPLLAGKILKNEA